ncbi:ABC-type sugar transport system, periplasmic component [Desulfosporosinus orientis DSM 765]|uniref:ABC-type sugar transport system, periplasmic component n=1 Tax=Desulfosporosinus orientis (strain ATCC 19365 / DSM 765 / NCIMB 8382 / VKM B-1628 / Singapore I) TaxID=768706 RepID=G7WGB1_DESOD|nr:ABC transporter substrate-binding protein [Desulfosporosinus orientis]AET70843.1 ABC-type sugar transport system, periplasmic component [Desulfosporosinus orientis DSM 765]
MRRFKCLGVIMAILMVLMSAVTGCGSTKTASESPDNGKPVEIEYWYGLGGKLGENMKAAIDKFNQSQNKVHVTGVAQASYDDTFRALQAGIAAKKAPAVVLLENIRANTLAQREVLAPLDDLVANDKNFNPEDFVPSFYKQGQMNGKLYYLPAYATTQVLYYRKDMFEKANIDPDKALQTWESLAEAAKKLTQRNGGEVAVYGWEPMWDEKNLIDATLSKGGKFLSEDGKTVTIDSPEWVDTWEFFRKAIFDDKIMRIHSGGQGWQYWYDTIGDVMKGNAAGYTGSSGDQGDLDFSIIAAHIQPGWEGHGPAPQAFSQALAIPAITSPEQKEAAFEWIKFFTGTENSADWSMKTGYIGVRKSSMESQAFKDYSAKNPQALVPFEQAMVSSPEFIDPTGGKILDALKKAADKVEIENVPAATALQQAQKEAQEALDKVLGK